LLTEMLCAFSKLIAMPVLGHTPTPASGDLTLVNRPCANEMTSCQPETI